MTGKPNIIKVVHIASGDLWAGAEVQLYTLAKELHKSDEIDITVILLNHGKLENELVSENIKTIIYDESKYNSVQILIKLIFLFKTISPDIIHTHRQKENILGSVASLFYKNTSSIRTTHGAPEHNPPWWKFWKNMFIFMDYFTGRFIQKRIVSVSSELANILQTKNYTKIHVIENGIDIDDTIAKSIPRSSQSGSINKTIRVGIVCRIVPVKRVDVFIQAAKIVLDSTDNIEFYIYGNGPLYNDIQDTVSSMNLSNMIHLPGFSEEILSHMKRLDILLITSDHEGLPMNLLEAMCLKIPVISNSVGGIPKVLDYGNNGTLIKRQLAGEYAQAIIQYKNNQQIFKDKAENAFVYLINNHSSSANAKQYIALYKAVTL